MCELSFASHLIIDIHVDVAQVSRILGHARTSITLDTYTFLPRIPMPATQSPVPSLNGSWRVERISGLLPPVPIRKRIAGTSGVTRIGFIRLPFRVDGRRLRYRPPLHVFVDELEPRDNGFDGRAKVLGREYSRFRLVRG